MLDALLQLDEFSLLWVLVKASVYGAVLLAAGSVLVTALLGSISEVERVRLRHRAVFFALVGLLTSASLVPLQAVFLIGDWSGLIDPGLLALVWEGPLGDSTFTRVIGLCLIACVWVSAPFGPGLAFVGIGLALFSFTQLGHSLQEPRWILSALVFLHLLCLAFWVGVFGSLFRALNKDTAAAALLAAEFGGKAVWAVGLLFLAGASMLWVFAGGGFLIFDVPYGRILLVKLLLFSAVMGFAALNKLFLTKALLQGRQGAAQRMRRSLVLEATLIGSILVVTAFLTTVSSPPSMEG